MKYNRPAVVVSAITGIVAAGGSIGYPSVVFPVGCVSGGYGNVICSSGSWAQLVVGALGVVLILDAAISLVGPRKAFYGIAGVSVVTIFVLVFLGLYGSVNSSFLLLEVALAAASAILSVMAARSRTGLSEQSNPMNLPVFG